MKTYGWLFMFVGLSALAQVQQRQQGGFGISYVTRRVPMVVPDIQANQFFAAGGVNLAPPSNIGGQPFGAAGQTPGLTTPFLVDGGTTTQPYLTYRAPSYVYTTVRPARSTASARGDAKASGSGETQVVAVVGSTTKVVTVPAER